MILKRGIALTGLFILILVSISLGQTNDNTVTIGVVVDGSWSQNDAISEMFVTEISDLLEGEFTVVFPESKYLRGDWTLQTSRDNVHALLDDPEVDIVLSMGLLCGMYAVQLADISKPLIVPFVVDYSENSIPFQDGKSGITNLNYLLSPKMHERHLAVLHEIFPYTKLAMFVAEPFEQVLAGSLIRFKEIANSQGIEMVVIPVGFTVDDALAAIPEDVDGAYVGGMLQLPPEEFYKLTQGLIQRKIPSLGLMGKWDVENGLMVGLTPEEYFSRAARRVALNIQRILLGEKPSDIPVAFSIEDHLVINMRTAREIGVYPPWSALTEAELINEDRIQVIRQLDFKGVVLEALEVNLELAAKDFEVSAGWQDVVNARANLLPQVNLSSSGVLIDKDRAEASFGSQAEKSITGSASFSQVVFSQEALANLSVQNRLFNSLEYEREQAYNDLVLTTTNAYINLLRAKTVEDIQKENLKRTRSNLELAEIRNSVGSSSRAEVFRWESEVASNRKDVISANANRNLAEMELNRILNRPLEESFTIVEVGIDNVDIFGSAEFMAKYLGNPWSFKKFREFMVNEGVKQSTELAALDELIKARDRYVTSTGHAFWMPTVALSGEVSRNWYEGGAGSESASLPGFTLSQADNTNWQVGLSVSFPLFKGGAKFAERRKASSELAQLQKQREEYRNRIEQYIRASLHMAGASHAGAGQTVLASEAAQKNLDLVVDSYSRGIVSIVELIDAQNAALVAELAAADARYVFLLDWLRVQRSINRFIFLCSADERSEFVRNLETYYSNSGITVSP